MGGQADQAFRAASSMSRYLTRQEVAEVIGVPPEQVDRWIADGRLKSSLEALDPSSPFGKRALCKRLRGPFFHILAVNDLICSLTADELRGINPWDQEGQVVS